ncbi:hypothetical protein L4G58_003136 [Salmonella enterica]|nr:hypothetical protein [Salmonella enterica]
MEARQGGDGLPAPFTTAPVPVREVAHRQTQQEEKPTEQRYQPVRHRYGHYWQRQRQRQRRDYQQNRNIADRLQHIDTHTLTPPGHQALAEIRGAAGAAYFAGRQSLPGFCARADRRLNRLPGKISY